MKNSPHFWEFTSHWCWSSSPWLIFSAHGASFRRPERLHACGDHLFSALAGIFGALPDLFSAQIIFSAHFWKNRRTGEKNARTVEKNHSTGRLNTRTGGLNTSTGHLNSPTARLNTRRGRSNSAVINKNSAPAKIHPALANFARAPAVRTRAPVAKNDALAG